MGPDANKQFLINTLCQLHYVYACVSSGYGETEQDNRLDVLEVCAGSHRLADAAAEYGMRSTALDETWFDAAS